MLEILGIVHRDKLMEVLKTFLDEDELRLIRLLLSDTSLEARVNRSKSIQFSTTIGTPQGDDLSPVLFIIYLVAALRDLWASLPDRPVEDASIPLHTAYADDVDFLS